MRTSASAILFSTLLLASGIGPSPAAAHPVLYLFEGESFTTRTGGSTFSEPGASGGAAWRTTTTASISSSWFAEHTGTYRIVVKAQGIAVDGVEADMTVFVDARAVGHWRVTNTYENYVVDDPVLSGTHTLRILFASPGTSAGASRTLIVDTAQVELIGNGDPPALWREAESAATRSTGGVFSDQTASGGQAWNLWSNGYVRTSVTVGSPTTFRTTLWARGDLPGGVPATMALRVDNVIKSTFSVTSSTLWQEHTSNISVAAGTHTFDIMFTNDANGPAGDRNLRVDALRLIPLAGAAPPPAPERRFEAESFTTLVNGAIQNDPTATGGKVWNQWSNGVASMTLSVASAERVQLAIRARGTIVENGWPDMELRIDGAVLDTWSVAGGNFAVYTAVADLSAGTHTIGIAFTNDARVGTQDRNLYFDHLEISGSVTGTAPPPPPPPAGETQRFEVEAFPTRSDGGIQTQSTASAGKVWNQWANGAASMPLTLGSAQRLDLTIRARGSAASSVWPAMELRVDGVSVGQWTVATANLASFNKSHDFGAGAHTIAIAFTNDAKTAAEDRNLFLDHLEVRSATSGGTTTTPPPTPEPSPTPPAGTTPPPSAGASQWPQGGYDVNGSHFNANEAVIGAKNAASLRQVWNFATTRSVFGTPAVVDGELYFGDTGGIAYAVDTATGTQVWKNSDAPGNIANSMAFADGRIFHGKSGGELIARNASTGAVLWQTRLDTFRGTFIWSSPVHHDGKLYVGVASSQEAAGAKVAPDFRGSFVRVDAVTGVIDWRYYIVPTGYTGGAMWSTAALDPETRTVYFGTGNAYTAPAHARTDAIIALNADTGALRWSTQGYANDVWTADNPDGPDNDFAMPVIIWKTSTGQKLVGAGNKAGDFFALDPQTGALIYRVHPQRQGQGFFGPAAVAYGRIYAGMGEGDKVVIAMDADNGRVLWRAPVSAGFTGGITAANGVVYGGTRDGAIWAFDAMTGAQLWKGEVPGGSLGIVLGTPSVAEGKLLVPYMQTSYGSGPGGIVAYSI